MNTPSHWLMTIVGGKIAESKLGSRIGKCPRMALTLGSVAPDLPLYFLSFGGIWYFSQVLGWEQEQVAEHLFKNLFYKDPIWIGLHNFLHSPTMLAILFCLTWPLRTKLPRLTRWLTFFLTACLLHSFIDVFTHFDDGPLLFFPFNWEYRFSSLVSYWDPAHFGVPFMVFEGLLDIALIAWLIKGWWKRRLPH